MPKPKILIAGIGGASLGTELLKALRLADRYELFGCDISPLAFGHYEAGFAKTFVVDSGRYTASVLDVCRQAQIQVIVAGGEQPLVLLNQNIDQIHAAGLRLAGNSVEITNHYSDKLKTFESLANLGFPIPQTRIVTNPEELADVPLPCVIKPVTGSGGSSFVFLATDHEEASLYINYLQRNGRQALVQEYISEREGEFTVGVLSLPDGRTVGSVAMQRTFNSKLSVLAKGKFGLISTGNSQGLIDDFPDVRRAAESIATAIGSRGPLNIQGRVRDGVFLPFEINPRFSASTYLRAMAGFNEVDIFIGSMLFNEPIRREPLRPGYYLRSFSETYVPKSETR